MLLFCFLALSCGYEIKFIKFPDPDGCDDTQWESSELFVVVHKEWRPYNSGTIYLCAGECGSPHRWEYGSNVFSSHKCAVKWINEEFADQPERLVAIYNATRMAPLKNETVEHVHVDERRWKTTKWEL